MTYQIVLFEHSITWAIHIVCRPSSMETSFQRLVSLFEANQTAPLAMLPAYVDAVVAMVVEKAEQQNVVAARYFAAAAAAVASRSD